MPRPEKVRTYTGQPICLRIDVAAGRLTPIRPERFLRFRRFPEYFQTIWRSTYLRRLPSSARKVVACMSQIHAVDETLNDIERHILQSIQEIKYGSVEILIHDSRIVQVERSEKFRFDVKRPANT